jgi:hypothetical protein
MLLSAGGARYFCVVGPDGSGHVEAWSGHPLQFGGQRRFGWQDAMAAELRKALAGLPAGPGSVLGARYMSTDLTRCQDVLDKLADQPLTVWEIWTAVTDEHDSDASYAAVRDYIRSRRQRK